MKDAYEKLLELETTHDALEATVDYLSGRIKPFLQVLEPVLICFPDDGPESLGGIFKAAVLRCEAKPVFWGPDYRWKELLRLAFDTHANTIIGPPQVVLGLMKIARATATPLNAYDVIVAGDPFAPWMIDGIKKGFDCNVWGCYAIHSSPVIGGFSCAQEVGIHIREEVFKPCLHRDDETSVINRGRLYFTSAKDPELTFDPQITVLLHHQPCCCGCDDPRVVDVKAMRKEDILREHLEDELLSWSSVLDYHVEYTQSGAALELVVFPGEAIPRLPSFAKQKVRFWNPQEDVPFCLQKRSEKISENPLETH